MAVVAVPGLTPSESARSPVCATGTAVVRRYTALSASRSDFDSTSSPFSMGVNLGFAPSRVQRGPLRARLDVQVAAGGDAGAEHGHGHPGQHEDEAQGPEVAGRDDEVREQADPLLARAGR